ncbi:MAG: LysR substrate-binding domain-containing protein [Martelella sp.]|uniref:LysR family transcriptional regulator n=1 Tax=Martelella sp. TaxID=1969699 RepID=UPI0032426457
MEIRQLRTFVHVAELGSITLASKRLGIAQPALTRQIQALEEELGVRIFNRHGRGVELTPQGQSLLIRATSILGEVEKAWEEIEADKAPLSGEVAFGMPPTISDALSTLLIEKFVTQHPRIRLQVVAGYSGHILDWLQSGTIDVGVIYEAKHGTTIRSQPLLVEKLFLIEPAGKSLLLLDPATLAEAVTKPLILPSRQHGLRLLIEDFAHQNGFTVEPVVEADSLPVQIDLVRRGLGATILPYLPVYRDVEAGLLTARPITSPVITRHLLLAHTIDRPMSAAVRLFSNLIVEETARLVSRGHAGMLI